MKAKYGYTTETGEYEGENFTATFERVLFDGNDGFGESIESVEVTGVTFLGFDIDIKHLCSGHIAHIKRRAEDATWEAQE